MRRINVVSDHNTPNPLPQLLQCHLTHSQIINSPLRLLVWFSNILNRHKCQNNLLHPTTNHLPVMLQSDPPHEYHENIYIKQLNLRLCTKKTQVLYPTQCFPQRNTNRRNNTFHYIILKLHLSYEFYCYLNLCEYYSTW
jgi:hypothetical protein